MQIERDQHWGMYVLHIKCPRRFGQRLLQQIESSQRENKSWSGFRILPPKIKLEHSRKAYVDIYVQVANCLCQFVATEILLYGLKLSYYEIPTSRKPTDYQHGTEFRI